MRMTLWWIGNAVLALVVAPLVIFLANRLVRMAIVVRRYSDDVLEHGVALTGTLDAIPKLVETKQLTGVARQNVGRYGAALAHLLAPSGAGDASGPGDGAPRRTRSARLVASREK